MKNNLKVKWDEMNDEKYFITYKDHTLIFQDINFYNIEFFNFYNDKLYLQYYLSNDDQTEFKKEYDLQNIKKLKFKNCEFHNMYIMKDFSKNISLTNCYIRGIFNYSNNKKSKNLLLKFSTFEDQVILQKSCFNKLVLKNSIFSSFVNFTEVKINKPLDLTSISFKEFINFLNMQCNIKNRETARIIKNSFEKQNNIIEANKYYALEMKKRYKELKKENNLVDKAIFFIHALSSDHSTDPYRAFFWIIIIGFIGGIKEFYYMNDFDLYVHCETFLLVRLILFIPLVIWLGYIIKNIDFRLSTCLLLLSTLFYVEITQDFSFSLVAKTLNMFSIKQNNITMFQLSFKIILVYLYYQFTISVRQNTRRK